MPLSINRRLLIAAFAALAVTGSSGGFAAPGTPPKILFVCQYGTVKSPTARELFKRRAAEKGVAVEASSRGMTPQDHLPPSLRDRLAAEGVDVTVEPTRQLTAADIDAADVVVIFDALPANLHPRLLLDWSDLPSLVNSYDTAKLDLDRRIEALVSTVAAQR